MTLREHTLLQLYCRGDRLGAPFEGAAPGSVTVERMLADETMYPNGTDETDTCMLLHRFLSDDSSLLRTEDDWYAALMWAKYHADHHRHTTYGKTWKDYFMTVDAVCKHGIGAGRYGFETLKTLSVDRQSASNGALALVPAAFLNHAFLFLRDASQLSHVLSSRTCGLTYQYMAWLTDWALGGWDSKQLPEDGYRAELGRECAKFGTRSDILAPGCALAALDVSQGRSVEDCLQLACDRGGDMDSYLSLALFFWGLRQFSQRV